MSAVVNSTTGVRRQLDRKPQPDEVVREADVTDASKLARLLTRILRDLAALRRRYIPRHIDFEDIAVDDTGATKYRFVHNFGTRVRFWPVDWSNAVAKDVTVVGGFGGTATFTIGPALERHADSDANTLVLVSHAEGTVTLRVEEVG